MSGFFDNFSIQAHTGGQFGNFNGTYGTSFTPNGASNFYCAGTGVSAGPISGGSAICYDRNGPSSTCVDASFGPFNASTCTNNDMSKTLCLGVGVGGGFSKVSASTGVDICYEIVPK
jgi:hypothetical protein